MKETLKNIFYDLVLIALILFVIWFFIFPIIEDSFGFQDNITEKINEVDECTNK